ncbi:MAG TPA: aminotransferase class III-fold pyridoxal phosphate-dependent enzyme [Dongiaceae bacterium]|nr:aminotransferase class III-fold pyridoxal phosphate-dependent enzyme [Dongiaceae bacterium]
MHKLAQLDHRYVWHPFTQMRDWLQREPIVITAGKGAMLRDVHGRKYLDANASIWTNLHGHAHPQINAAIARQLKKIAHSSALGFANEPASLLAAELVRLANPKFGKNGLRPAQVKGLPAPHQSAVANPKLEKVFFGDDGSTALEVALKLAYQFARRTGRTKSPRFLALEGAYHGDTVGAVSLGHIDLFHKAYSGLLFKTDQVMSPYCYRCPFNRAKPERADAREYRKCNWECVSRVEQKFAAQKKRGNPYAGFVFEPLMQGAAGMIPQPAGWLRRVAEIARGHGAQLIADEVMTGFGRTGTGTALAAVQPNRDRQDACPTLFACHHEGVQPDYLCVAKGLSGGYLPLAATLTTPEVFAAFLGKYEEFKSFFHGHSFTGNQLGTAAGLASLNILESSACVQARSRLERVLRRELQSLWALPAVGDIRQVGLVVGVELVRDWRTRKPFALAERAGIRVCEAMARRGVLTRPVGNIIVLMPPYCTTPAQARQMVASLREAVAETLPK